MKLLGKTVQRGEAVTSGQIDMLACHVERLAVYHRTDMSPYEPDDGERAVYGMTEGYYETADLSRYCLRLMRLETGAPALPRIETNWDIGINLPPSDKHSIHRQSIGRVILLTITRITGPPAADRQTEPSRASKFGNVEHSVVTAALRQPGRRHLRMTSRLQVYDDQGYIDQSSDGSKYLHDIKIDRQTSKHGGIEALLRGAGSILHPHDIGDTFQVEITAAQGRYFNNILHGLQPEDALDHNPLLRPLSDDLSRRSA